MREFIYDVSVEIVGCFIGSLAAGITLLGIGLAAATTFLRGRFTCKNS